MEDFVTFEIAKKLKEKGFKEPCLCHYVGEDIVYNLESPIANNQLWFSHNSYDNIWHRDNIDAPTISQVLKWLRKEKDIYISIFIDDDSDTPVTYGIWKDTECVCHHQGEYFALGEWEECELIAIEYSLDNLIYIY